MTKEVPYERPQDVNLALEAWSQGVMVGTLILMILLTVANIQCRLLHYLVLIELLFAVPNGFFIFFSPPLYGWYLSATATGVIISWSLHNVISWIKIKPFLSKTTSLTYISSVVLVQGYWVLEIYANFTYFNNLNEELFPRTRPFEALCRDPWWLCTTVGLLYFIKRNYHFSLIELIRASPRFGVLLLSMFLSIVFIIVDVLSVTPVIDMGGINPFWKFGFVFKCFTDTIFLDDFKTVLDRLNEVHIMKNMRLDQDGGTVLNVGRERVQVNVLTVCSSTAPRQSSLAVVGSSTPWHSLA